MISLIKQKINLLRNEWHRYLIIFIWTAINLIIFLVGFFNYSSSLKYFYLRKIVNNGLSWSRASAMCINFNCSILLLLVCRNFISHLRYFLNCSKNFARTLDKHIWFHKLVGYTIIFFSIIHTVGHIFNLENFVYARNTVDKVVPTGVNATEKDLLDGLLSTLSLLTNTPGRTYINPIKTDHPSSILESFKLVAGVTGILMCIALYIIGSTSSEYIRRSFYNLFWYSHQLFAVLFLGLFCFHGIQGVVKKQTNLDKNNPQKCYLTYTDWSSNNVECDIPEFEGSMATSWIWVLVPMIIYTLERVMRLYRGLFKKDIESFRKHPSNVLELVIRNSGSRRIKYRAGQYVYLNVSEISFFEWHPFTVTSSPADPNLTVHIRLAGDWTGELYKKIDNIKRISIDGPYGTCAEDIFKYEKVILIGAGIGVTPYASILKHIWHILAVDGVSNILKKVYFFWICPSIDTFEWFGKLLKDLEIQMSNKNRDDLLDYRIYLTRGWTLKEAKQIAVNHDDNYDLFTGLQQKTNYGRPNFDMFFRDISQEEVQSSKLRVGVFFCGPSQLSKDLHKFCLNYSNDRIQFCYNKESF